MGHVRVEERPEGALCCAWCHEAGEALVACPECGALRHLRCAELAGPCPTHDEVAAARSRRERRWRAGAWALIAAGGLAGVLLWPWGARSFRYSGHTTDGWRSVITLDAADGSVRVGLIARPDDAGSVTVFTSKEDEVGGRSSRVTFRAPGSDLEYGEVVEQPGLGDLAVVRCAEVDAYLTLDRAGELVLVRLEDARIGPHPLPPAHGGAPETELIADLTDGGPVARLVALVRLEARAGRHDRPDVVLEAARSLTTVAEPWTAATARRLVARLEGRAQ